MSVVCKRSEDNLDIHGNPEGGATVWCPQRTRKYRTQKIRLYNCKECKHHVRVVEKQSLRVDDRWRKE